jgi:FKBP-type peptidyl-prolyl cis-trans isomerase FkpA
MKRIIIAFTALAFLFLASISCGKDDGTCTQKTVQSEDGAMQTYASTNGITATRHSSGMLYQIITAGDPAKMPTLSSTVSAKYTGRFMDGNIFDQSTTAISFPLSGVIAGWQLGLPLIGKGGKIKLIIPSSLAYGCTGRSSIPPYAILFFDVELTDVQ